jgi:hypothetical protein
MSNTKSLYPPLPGLAIVRTPRQRGGEDGNRYVAREYRVPAIGSSTNFTCDSAAMVSSTTGVTRSMNVIAGTHTPRY